MNIEKYWIIMLNKQWREMGIYGNMTMIRRMSLTFNPRWSQILPEGRPESLGGNQVVLEDITGRHNLKITVASSLLPQEGTWIHWIQLEKMLGIAICCQNCRMKQCWHGEMMWHHGLEIYPDTFFYMMFSSGMENHLFFKWKTHYVNGHVPVRKVMRISPEAWGPLGSRWKTAPWRGETSGHIKIIKCPKW